MSGKKRTFWKYSGIAIVAVALLFPVATFASTAISQGFKTSSPIATGTLVSTNATANTVESATVDTAPQLTGVVGADALVELSSDTSEVQVATSGTVSTLVSTINGDIKSGDRVSVSPIVGVGMKNLSNGYIVGVAQADFSQAKDVISREVVDRNGNKTTTKVGLLPVQVGVSFYTEPDKNTTILPAFLLDLAREIAGRDVSVIRIIIALVVLLVGIGSITTLIFAAVRSSIISIGRNPLAASAVHRSLFQVILLAIGVLLVMLGAVYLVLVV